MVNPGLISPRFSAWSRMYMAMRSLMEPVGFMYSHLTSTVAEPGGTILFSLTRGVLPTASRMVFLVRTQRSPIPAQDRTSDKRGGSAHLHARSDHNSGTISNEA